MCPQTVPRWAHLPQPKTGRLFLYVDSYRQPAGEINKKAMIDHDLLYGSAWMGEKALLDILYLFAHLLDQYLQLNRGVGDLGVNRF